MHANERLQPGDAVRIRGERWVVHRQTTHGIAATLDVRGGDRGNAGRTARFLLPFEPVERLAVDHTPKVVRPARWRLLARSALAAATPRIDSLRTARTSRFDVMPYQLEPALAVTGGIGCRVLIADDVGLGKTVQAGVIVAELLERQPDGHALVVCPAGLRSQWQEELRARFGLAATLLDANGLAQVAADFDATANPWSACRLIVTSIDFIKRPEVMRALEGMVWDAVVLDEVHNLATRSDRATAAAALAWRARTLVLLSATPHSGDAAAFSRLCSLGDSGGRFPLVFFSRTRADTGMPANRRTRWLEICPSAAEAGMLTAFVDYARSVWKVASTADAARLAMTVLLRRASSSAASLARSLERRLESLASSPWPASLEQLGLPFTDPSAEDEEPTLTLAAPGLPDIHEERARLEHLIALAHLAARRESKIAAIERWLSRVHEPVLVFTEYRDTLTHLHEALSKKGLSGAAVMELHGGMTRAERQVVESSFVKGPARVLLATDAASEGLNLHQRCRCVINLEIPWSPVRLEQRIGRVDRIGQARCVHAINLIAAGTHELAIVERVRERQQRATEALRAAATSDFATAALILIGAPEVQEQSAVVFPTATRRPDLADRTRREAEWITTARRIGTSLTASSRRPFVTVLTRVPRRLLWVAEVSTCGADSMPVWTTLVGVEMSASGGTRCDVRSIVRDFGHVDQIDVRLQPPVVEAIAALKQFATLNTHREQVICAGIRVRHARIAAELLQPGLFDRRAERGAAAQSSVLEEALAQCQTRIEELATLAGPQAAPPVIRFAALV